MFVTFESHAKNSILHRSTEIFVLGKMYFDVVLQYACFEMGMALMIEKQHLLFSNPPEISLDISYVLLQTQKCFDLQTG